MDTLQQADYGTPARSSARAVSLEIDGIRVTVPEGTSLIRAAAEVGISIPKLCATDSLEPFGSCRLCLVEIEGNRGYPASCTTPAEEGMKVATATKVLQKLRRGIMELYLSDHPADCGQTPAGDMCEIHELAHSLDVTAVRYGCGGANHLNNIPDVSNPYFVFDQGKCIVCSRCVRACEEIQGTYALSILGRGFESRVIASMEEDFLSSECVSCGACVQACPTDALLEKSVIEFGTPEEVVVTTCAYCGVGCSFRVELKRDGRIVRMVPDKRGKANHGHSCVKGRFAWGYALTADRVTKPMIRKEITDPWREVSWEKAIGYVASEFKRIRRKCGSGSIGGITSSRCTNEEAYLVQKLIRGAFGNNNVDTCARVCHSPTGYGLKTTLGESAGTQDFDSVMQSDVVMVIGANPTDAHPVFASQMKCRLRKGARLIVVDPRAVDLVRSPHVHADYHLKLRPGTNVALLNSLAYVIVTGGLADENFVAMRCEREAFARWKAFVAQERNSPEVMEGVTGVSAQLVRAAARLYATGGNASIYYGLGVTEHSQGSTGVIAIANLAMATGNIGREGVGVNPLRGQNNVQGSCDMGSFPHELPGYRHISDPVVRGAFEKDWGVVLDAEPGLRIPNMFDAALDGSFRGLYLQGEDVAQSDPNTTHVVGALKALECLVVQDLFLNETAKYAHVFLPGSSFLEKNGTFTNAERRISRVRKVMAPLGGLEDWEVTVAISNAMGFPMHYRHPSEIMDEIARLTPAFRGVTYEKIDQLGSLQWPCNEGAPDGTPVLHRDAFIRGLGYFVPTEYVPTEERVNGAFPLLLTTGRILSQYNVGTQTRRTGNVVWHPEDRLEIHPHDAEDRGIGDGDLVGIKSRSGEIVLHALVAERMQPGVVYTTFHHPETGTNVVTTENSDWATNCPEYKVTAVEVTRVMQPSEWQKRDRAFAEEQRVLFEQRKAEQAS